MTNPPTATMTKSQKPTCSQSNNKKRSPKHWPSRRHCKRPIVICHGRKRSPWLHPLHYRSVHCPAMRMSRLLQRLARSANGRKKERTMGKKRKMSIRTFTMISRGRWRFMRTRWNRWCWHGSSASRLGFRLRVRKIFLPRWSRVMITWPKSKIVSSSKPKKWKPSNAVNPTRNKQSWPRNVTPIDYPKRPNSRKHTCRKSTIGKRVRNADAPDWVERSRIGRMTRLNYVVWAVVTRMASE
mmetsp:Transcript_1988/g.4292  ORF Transcript_1988/g.4292 Transcript_1988/m.4292 type:complete len:240 (-) Transcript_1988:346-1065(-)